jgi:hypothetical protein
MQASFRVRSEIRVLVQSARNCAIMPLGQLGLIVGLFVLFLGVERKPEKPSSPNGALTAAAGMSIGVYSLVLLKPRMQLLSWSCYRLQF